VYTFYICALPNETGKGAIKELFSEDPAAIEAFAAEHDKPGYGIFDCISPLKLGARKREISAVAELPHIVTDHDPRDLEESANAILDKLLHLPLTPSEIRSSGRGYHSYYRFNEPIVPDEDPEGFTRALDAWRSLVAATSADPLVVNPHGLIRRPGTHNSKCEPPAEVTVLCSNGTLADIGDLEDLIDALPEQGLFRRKAKAPDTGGDEGAPVVVEDEWDALAAGKSPNEVYKRIIPSLLRSGDHPQNVLEHVVSEAMVRKGEAEGWKRTDEVVRVSSSILSAYNNLLLKDHDFTVGPPAWLHAKLQDEWYAKYVPGATVRINRNRFGYFVDVKAPRKDESGQKVLSFLKTALEFTSSFIPPDYLVDGILQRRFIYALTAKTGDGKTAWGLLLAYCVATGMPLGQHETEPGAVGILAGENPDDVRMRWIAMAERLGFDQATIPVDFVEGVHPIPAISAAITTKAKETGREYALIIVDSSAAYFPGDEENSNTQLGKHARTLRALTTLPGGPCVIVICHPTKAADPDRLLPRGGGAFVNEVDGNLVCKKRENTFEVHWHEKFRGPDFDPMPFSLQEVTVEALKDSKGRHIPSVMARAMSDEELTEHLVKARQDENAILRTVYAKKGIAQSLTDLAVANSWFSAYGDDDKSRARHAVDRLIAAKLLKRDRGELVMTEAGEKAAKKI
jgi:hypothetical protein